MIQAGIDISNTEDLADLKHAINVLLMPFKRVKEMEQSFKDNLEKLKDTMEHQELDEQLEEIKEQNDNKRTEAILDAFQPLIEQFGLEFNNETKLFEFTNEILNEDLVTKLQEINNRLNGIDYSKSVWLNTVNEVIAEINTMGLSKPEATEVAKFILNKIINHKDSDLIYKSIVPVVEVFTPSITVTNQTIKVPISSPILHRLNRNGLVYENAKISETAFADLSEVVNGIRVLMNQNNNKITFVKESIVYPGNKGARVYTTFVIPGTNFSLPSLEHTKIVKDVLAHENADEMLRKIKEFVDNVAYTLTPEQAMEIYHEIMKDEAFKTSFEKHFTSPADNAKKRIEQITKTIKSYEKRLENMSDIREDLVNHQTIIDLYENNEKEITLTFENNVELVTIPIKTSTSNVGFNAPSTSRVTMNKFNNDATNENKLENHFKLAIPKQTSSGKQYTSNGVDVTLNSEQNGLVLIPLSENSVFDANKPFGGNEYISLQSIQFPIELGNEIYSKLKALKRS